MATLPARLQLYAQFRGAGLSQRQACERAGISRGAAQRYEAKPQFQLLLAARRETSATPSLTPRPSSIIACAS